MFDSDDLVLLTGPVCMLQTSVIAISELVGPFLGLGRKHSVSVRGMAAQFSYTRLIWWVYFPVPGRYADPMDSCRILSEKKNPLRLHSSRGSVSGKVQ